jgi:hypothetical protein
MQLNVLIAKLQKFIFEPWPAQTTVVSRPLGNHAPGMAEKQTQTLHFRPLSPREFSADPRNSFQRQIVARKMSAWAKCRFFATSGRAKISDGAMAREMPYRAADKRKAPHINKLPTPV